MHGQDELVGLARPVHEGVPMAADALELEANRRSRVLGCTDGDLEVLGQEFRRRQALLGGHVREDPHAGAALVAQDIFLPGHCAAVGEVKMRSVAWEMGEAEFFVVHGEMVGLEGALVG